ncbi:hypothetical protein L3X38_019312 [Prunus dulcis]|uniref:AMP-dependent synthetase/ligase domain-containing protein n=1 Tax=Prunus dulcis TaxID=3755 RepID=A0AAD4WAT0_PRUDU|nr:hypothetical protein L3X38_019312 [Prunus dulcis]
MAEASRVLQTTLIPSFHPQHRSPIFQSLPLNFRRNPIQCTVSTSNSTKATVPQKIPWGCESDSLENASALQKWLTDSGLPPQKMALQKVEVGERGLVALKNIRKGEKLLFVPPSLFITADSEWTCGEAGKVLKQNGVPDLPFLATYLISEASSLESSRWSNYISALPRQPYLLLCWTREELDRYLEASQIRQRAIERVTNVVGTYGPSVMLAAGCSIGYGSALTFTDNSNKIKKGTKGDATILKPTIMTAVPAILDRVRDGVLKKVEEKGGLAKNLFNLGFRRRLAAVGGSWFGAFGLERMVWDAVVFTKIRSILGGRIRFMLCGGAPLSAESQRFINICMGAPIGQGYGLTETFAGATFSEWDDTTVGRVGPPLPCGYIKEDVILYILSGIYAVYVCDILGMRWFYTGDIGMFHPDGCLEIIDRKKDIVKLQHGEYISLGKVEASLQSSNYVDNIMAYADPSHNYCIALVVPARQALEKWAQEADIKYNDFSELCGKAETVTEVQQSLSKVAKAAKLDKFETPAKIQLLADPWTPESGLVTAAMKIKREQIKSKFKNELQKLYA